MRHRRPLLASIALVALVVLAGLPAGAGAATPPFTAAPANPAVHHLHEVYYVQQHNTFDYGSTLTGWLDAGLRSVELDIIDKTDWELDPNGPYVSHDSSAGDKNCSGNPDRLGHCLGDIAAWMDAHPGQGPIVVFVDMKSSWDPLNAWYSDEIVQLDDKVAQILGPRLFTAGDLYQYATGSAYSPGATSPRQAVSAQGWPLLSALSEKIVIAYTGGRYGQVNQGMGGAIEQILAQPGRGLPYGFFCPDVESEPHELLPGGTVDGVSTATSQFFVCSNLQSQDHYQITANAASAHRQLIHLWGNHVYGNGEYVYNYIAVAHGISAIGRDSGATDTFGGSIPLVGVRRSLPGYFQLRPTNATSKCADVAGSSGSNGARVTLQNCTAGSNQRFVYTAESQLRPQHANTRCLDIKGGDAGNGNVIHIWDCDGGNSEKWLVEPGGRIRSYDDNRAFCLMVSGGSTSSGASFVTYTCGSGGSQTFQLEPVPDWAQTQF